MGREKKNPKEKQRQNCNRTSAQNENHHDPNIHCTAFFI